MNGKEKELFSLNKVKFASFLQNSIWSPEKKRKTKVTFVLGSLEIERGRAKNEHVYYKAVLIVALYVFF